MKLPVALIAMDVWEEYEETATKECAQEAEETSANTLHNVKTPESVETQGSVQKRGCMTVLCAF